MPLDLTRLLQPLAASEASHLDAADARLTALDTLAEQGRFDAAAAAVDELLAEGIWDIRPLPYYLYHAFSEGGFHALGTVLDVVDNLLGPSFAAVGPERRREDYFNKRLGWLFEKIDKALEYHEKKATPEWARWQATLTAEAAQHVLTAGARVAERLAPAVYAHAATFLGQLLSRVRHAPVEPHDGAPAEAPALAPERRAKQAESALAMPPAPPEKAAPMAARAPDGLTDDGLRRVELLVTQPFVDLCRKLKVFEALVKKEQYQKAAVVADDIAHIVDQFDPRAYFPELFAKYAALQSQHVRALAQHAEERESPPWRALQQFYRVDLNGFVES